MIEPLVSIKIYAPNGKAYYSDAAQTSTDFPVTDSCERSAKLMGDDYVRLVFKLADKVTFAAFSYIEYGGQSFFLKEQYIPTPNGCFKDASGVSSAYYSYDVKFVSVGNMLSKATCYRHVVVSGTNGGEWDEPEITLNGTLETMYVIVMGAIQQYCKRIENSDCAHFRELLATIPANGLTKVGGVTSPNTEKVKLTAGTELVSFSFQGDNIANVCTTIANSYTDDDKDTEWYITEDSSHSLTLHFAKCEDTDSVTAGTIPQYSDYTIANTSADKDLKPYRTGGLSKVEYAQEWSGIAQTIVPFGSERNMSGVRRKDTDAETQMVVTFGKRLRLDKSHSVEVTATNGTKTTYNGAYAVKNRKGETVILQVNAQGGITNPDVSTGIEEVKFFDDIYPQCHFRVTSVSVRNKKQDDDIVPEYTIEAVPITSTKEQLVANGFYPLTIEEATTLSVRFESGLLNGREFEIANKTRKDVDATTYSLKFTIVADGSLEDGTLIPSGNFIPKGDDTQGEGKGDEFALFNMKMPQEYVELAQQELAQKAYDELLDLQETRPEVKCTTDPVHFNGELYFGQVMAIKSELFGGADNEFISRVISFSHKLTTPASVSFSLASAIMQGVLSEMNNAISDVTSITGYLGQRAINLSRRGWRDASEVADMLDSITAEMMLVGNEKYQFAFTPGISCVNNSTADSSGVVHFRGLKITYGTLQHTQEPYINYANKGVWELPSATLTTDHNGETLNADTPYYLYAVVADDGNAARYELWGNNEDSRAEDEAYLLLGVLSSEFEDNGVAARVFSRTNGYTAIEGGTITTEQIQDAGRNLIIDFQSNPPRIIARNNAEIIGNIRFKAGDTQTAEEQLRDLGILVDDAQSTADDAATAAANAQSALDNLQIGGRNLLKKSNSYTWGIWGTTWASGVTDKYTAAKTDEYTQVTINTKPTNILSTYIGVFDKITNALWAGRKVTVSAMLYSSYQDTVKIGFVERKNSTVLLDQYYNHNADIAVEAQKWTQVSWSFESPVDLYADVNGQTPNALYVVIAGSAIPEAGSYWRMKNVKIEFGNKPTDWTPAPEDVEAEITESKTYAKGLVDTLGTTLQNQIDGVVDSYFMEGAPTLSNAPAKDWTADELKARHEGDTYTNIQQYIKLEKDVWEQGSFAESQVGKEWVVLQVKYDINQKPIRLAELMENKKGNVVHLSDYNMYKFAVLYFDANKKMVSANFWKTADFVTEDYPYIAISVNRIDGTQTSIADVVASGVVINPDAGKSWRWCNMEDTDDSTWHWHEIADSDAVRALQNAAKAQDTADGKRRVFVAQPTPPYDLGDLWAQGDGDGKDILKCKTAKTAGQTFAQADWEAASSALRAAGDAQTAADAAKETLANIASDSVLTAQEKVSVRTEWASIQAEFEKHTANAKACWGDDLANDSTPAKDYDWWNDKITWSATPYQTKSGKILEWKVTTETQPTTYYKSNKLANTTTNYSIGTLTASNPTFSDSMTVQGQAVDLNGWEVCEIVVYMKGLTIVGGGSLTYLYISPRAKRSGLLYEKVDFTVTRNSDGTFTTVGTVEAYYYDVTVYSLYKTAYDNLNTYLTSTAGLDTEGDTAIVSATFKQKFSDYYAASIELQNAIAARVAELEAQAAIDDMEVGGENLYYLANPFTRTASSTNNYYYDILLENLERGKKYTFSCEKSERLAGTATQYQVRVYNFATSQTAHFCNLSIGNTKQTCTFTVPDDGGNWCLLVYSGVHGSTGGNSLQWTNIMIQKGDKATSYQQPSWKPLYNQRISINYINGAQATGKNLLYNIPAGRYQATMAYESKGSGVEQEISGAFDNSCVVWFKKGGYMYSDVLAITDWGETVQIAQAADVYVYTGVKAFIKEHIKDPDSTGIYFLNDGTWSISTVRIITYVTDSIAGSAAEAKTKADALDYLKAALTNGSTQITGGLTMTNVLMLKNLQNIVTAGLSGLTTLPAGASTASPSLSGTDNVLFWGGGSYEEAFYAANNANYYKSSSSTTPITTLIKKDGTGKIGIFQIDDSKVAIKTADGSIVIDIGGSNSDGGIYVYDKYAICRIVISQEKSISDYFGKQASQVAALAAGSSGLGDNFTELTTAPTEGIPQTPFDAQPYEPDTVSYYPLSAICVDGFISAKSKDIFFVIDNSGEEQRIIAKGLSDTATQTGQFIKKSVSWAQFASAFQTFMEEGFKDSAKNSGFSVKLSNIINSLPYNDIFITTQ